MAAPSVSRSLLVAIAVCACSALAPAAPSNDAHREPPRRDGQAPKAPAPSVVSQTTKSKPGVPTAPAAGTHPSGSAKAPDKPTPERASAEKSSPAKRPEPAKAAEPVACPAGMLLVDGDYCSDVDYECLKSWYDPSNKKTICEEFKPESKCVGKKTKKRFCIDQYTWPNEKGARPEVMNRFHQAELKCAAVGKRLCTESEWTLACEGPRMLPFPYGYVRDTSKCLGDVEWDAPDMKKVAARDPEELARLWKGVRNGSQPGCVSEYGVADLPGNVDEVVANETQDGSWRAKYDSVHTGGPWYKGTRNQCRPKIYTHDEGFYYYFLGFRCCAEPDGKETDFRTPRQIKEGWKLERVERIAGFSLAELKTKLEEKKQGNCRCSERDVRCKTMCGTLLGPAAKDYR
ncbi:MAG TPA: SUMF1/EgtB/PvdO family nonheme iron enzyme [Polyangiaceae bacterium]|nr:SUMF1/EgtB/PvdO family nonheme iron enzyme [Polyangiaceae bacterium]